MTEWDHGKHGAVSHLDKSLSRLSVYGSTTSKMTIISLSNSDGDKASTTNILLTAEEMKGLAEALRIAYERIT